MTNTKATAAHLASKGRYGDSTLVHMSPIEVWALERMSPNGKLTRNPDTGMPEAFSLGDVLPAVAGIGASMLFPGAGLLLPSLLSGATSYAVTGDLGKGLMSGLLSYGVGSALDLAANPAAQAVTDTAASTTGQVGAETGANVAANATAPVASETMGAGANQIGGGLVGNAPNAAPGLFNPNDYVGTVPSFATTGAPTGVAETVGQGAFATSPIASSYTPAADLMTNTPRLEGLDAIKGAYRNFEAAPAKTLERVFVDNAKSTTLPIAGSVIGSMALEPPTPFTPVGGTEPTRAELERRYPEQFPTNRDVVFPGSDYVPGTSGEFDYFPRMAAGGEARSLMGSKDALYAKGGIADQDGAAASKANIEAEAKMALIDHHPKAAEALARYERAFGREALDRLKGTVGVAGGRIRGAGGGLDDLIPGTIEGRKDVRLADGEFVVPADVVSMLGDGSSDHGVRKLHEMMDRIRVNKTGTKKQAKSIKDHKVMPA